MTLGHDLDTTWTRPGHDLDMTWMYHARNGHGPVPIHTAVKRSAEHMTDHSLALSLQWNTPWFTELRSCVLRADEPARELHNAAEPSGDTK